MRSTFRDQRARRVLICLALLSAYGLTHKQARAENPADDTPKGSGKIGRGRRSLQLKTCQLSYSGQGLAEGDLAEIVEGSGKRKAVVKMERLKKPNGKLIATVVIGEDKCEQLTGLTVRPLSAVGISASSTVGAKYSLISLASKMSMAQSAMPGLALNKFLSPGYTQKGFAVQGIATFPREPIKLGPVGLNFISESSWSTLITSPALDIVKDGKVEGTQNVSTQSLNLRAGTRLYYLDSKIWSGLGLVLLDSMQSRSIVSSTTGADADNLLRVVRDLKGQGFGFYGEQGFTLNGSAFFSLHGGLGISTSIKTPIVEDGDSTNSSEAARLEGLPFFAGARVHAPFLNWLFAEVNLDYRSYAFAIPLVNDGITRAQYDLLMFSAGIGIRY